MSSAFLGLSIANTALQAYQEALDVTGNNLANVDTTGYSRETINFAGTDPTTFYSDGNTLMIGTGVNVASIERIRNMYLQGTLASAQSEDSRLTTLTTNMTSVQTVVPATSGSDISSALSSFFSAWSALSSNPNQEAELAEVQSAGETLASQISGTYNSLATIQSEAQSDVTSTFDQVDELTSDIANLNKEIVANSVGGTQPNNLLDQRDQDIQSLSQLVNISTQTYDNGTVAVYMGQDTLVDSAGSHAIPRDYDAASQTVTDGHFTYSVTGGELAGDFQTITTVGSYMSSLDTLANNLQTQVNTLSETGTNNEDPPQTGVAFFNGATGAANFDVSAAVKADPDAISSGTSGTSGDGGLALSISELSTASISGLGNVTFGEYYDNLASKIGTDADTYTTQQDTQAAVVTQITNQVQSNSGVSLDDEMSNMLRYQRSYEAAAKAITIFDTVTGDLISMMQS
jgi:flagellar hook-associated protein 1 FlgK